MKKLDVHCYVCAFSIVPCLRKYFLVQYILLHFFINSFHLMFMVLILISFHLKSKFPWRHLWNWSSFLPDLLFLPSQAYSMFPFIWELFCSLCTFDLFVYSYSFQPLIFAIFFLMSLQKPLFFWQFLKLFAFQVTVLNSFINIGSMKLETICISWVFKILACFLRVKYLGKIFNKNLFS